MYAFTGEDKMKKLLLLGFLFLSGCAGSAEVRIEKKRVIFHSFGFGLYNNFLIVEELEADLKKEIEETVFGEAQ